MTPSLPPTIRARSLALVLTLGALAGACSYDLYGFGTDPSTGAPEPWCGDGLTDSEEGEECDPGPGSPNADVCTDRCMIAMCGNGAKEAAEECDPGDTPDQGQCNSRCKMADCGDGEVRQEGPTETIEECDDANLIEDDGCTSLCRRPSCRDGILQAGEECDPGMSPSDSCTIECKLAFCGDRVRSGSEECDDGNKDDTDSCTACKNAFCGDGFTWVGHEDCDDGNTADNDACPATCVEKPPTCGDMQTQKGEEECDPSNPNDPNLSKCREDCRIAKCGDNIKDDGEECDGDVGPEFACRACKEYHESVWHFAAQNLAIPEPTSYEDKIYSPNVNTDEVVCLLFRFWDYPSPQDKTKGTNKDYRFAHDFEFELGVTHPDVGELNIFVTMGPEGRVHLMRRPGVEEGFYFDNTEPGAVAALESKYPLRFTMCDGEQGLTPDLDCELPSAELVGVGDDEVACVLEDGCPYKSNSGSRGADFELLTIKGFELIKAGAQEWTTSQWRLCIHDPFVNESGGIFDWATVKVWRRKTAE